MCCQNLYIEQSVTYINSNIFLICHYYEAVRVCDHVVAEVSLISKGLPQYFGHSRGDIILQMSVREQ